MTESESYTSFALATEVTCTAGKVTMNTNQSRYAPSAIALHWLLAALVFALYGLGWYMVEIPKGAPPVA